MSVQQDLQWQSLCNEQDLVADAGIAAWTPDGPVALFWLPSQGGALFCIGHYDPLGQANVLARGIVGDRQGEPVVASPLYKQHYSLLTGTCLEDGAIRVPVYPVRLSGGKVEIGLAREQGVRRDSAA